MEGIWQQFEDVGRSYLLGLIAPLGILVLGWLAALIASQGVRRLLRRADMDRRLGRWMSDDEAAAPIGLTKWAGRSAYYAVMLIVLVAFFQAVGLTMVTGPLTEMLTDVLAFAPRLVSAGALLLVAWVLGSVLRFVIGRAFKRLRLDERLGESAELRGGAGLPLSQGIATAAYWLVFLLFLPAVLSALALEGVLQPLREMVVEMVGFLPNLLAAVLILLIGWFAARIVQRIATSLLTATTLDRVSRGTGLGNVLGDQSLSDLIGRVIYVLVLIPAVIMALDALDMVAVSDPASQMLATILNFLPSLFSAGFILFLAYLVGRLIAGLATELLSRAGFNRILVALGLSHEQAEGQRAPAEVVGKLILVTILLFAAIEAARLIGFAAVSSLLTQLTVFGSRVLLGLVIFGLGLYVANLVSGLIRERGAVSSGLMASAARLAVMVLTTAMALRHVGVANEIITSAFTLLLGAIAVAVALAFGLGSRDIAAREVEKWLKSLRGDEPKSE
ncbi:MAG: mechanosensitive ion channel [Gemmatimonadota bacterium]